MSREDFEEELFHYHRGRALKLPQTAAERLFPSAYGGRSGLTPELKARGLVKNTAEALVKVDKASTGIKGSDHLQQAASYLSRNGRLELEDEAGAMLNKAEVDALMEQWSRQTQLSKEDDPKRPAEFRRFILSSPRGTNPQALQAAVRELAQEVFARQGYSYVMVLHEHNSEHPEEPDHPHVHILVKAVNERDHRLNIRKQDLRYLRERFAVLAREHGIELNATTRASRSQPHKAKTQARFHSEKRRDFSHPYAKERKEELVEAMVHHTSLPEHEAKRQATVTRSKVRDNLRAYAEELRAQGQTELAQGLEQRASAMSAEFRTSQEEILQRAQAELEAQLKAEKVRQQREAIRRRKAQEMHSQTQAQKWAIHRKKQRQRELEQDPEL